MFAGDVDEEQPVDNSEYATEVPEKEVELSSNQEDFEAGMVGFLVVLSCLTIALADYDDEAQAAGANTRPEMTGTEGLLMCQLSLIHSQ
jgi:hypothetical protein